MRAIAAMAANRVIGKDGKLPWRIPGDLKFFKKMTLGCTCIVGKRTYVDLPPLPDRKFVVMTRDINSVELTPPVVGVVDSNHVPIYHRDDVWVIGGAETYKRCLPHCTDLYLTRIFKQYDGDTMFPTFDHLFIQDSVIERTDDYAIVHYKRRKDNATIQPDSPSSSLPSN